MKITKLHKRAESVEKRCGQDVYLARPAILQTKIQIEVGNNIMTKPLSPKQALAWLDGALWAFRFGEGGRG